MYNTKEKIAGQPCADCPQGKYVKSPKSGKIFCSSKCWLNKPQGYPSQEPQEDVIRLDRPSEGGKPSQEYWEAKEERTRAEINHLNARTAAIEIVKIKIEKGDITGVEDIELAIENWTATIEKI